MPIGEVGIGYGAVSFTATGGQPPYAWAISVGSLPGGITLSSNSVSGTPSAAGTSTFTVQATDAIGQVATSARSINIQPALALTGNCQAQCSVEEGCTTVCGNLGSQAGGIPPFTYTPLGTLPPGMGLSGLVLTGPFPLGSYKFGVRVTDALGASASIAAAFAVFAHIALAAGSCTQKAGSDLTCVVRMPYSAGSGKPVAVAVDTRLAPKGTTAVLQPGIVLVTIPAQLFQTSGKFSVMITDSAVCGPAAGQRCTATATATYSFQ